MFRSATDYHQGVNVFLVKITELKHEYSFIHPFIMCSVNPHKVKQPMGYRTCHNINVL
jgi:hypothetical protein